MCGTMCCSQPPYATIKSFDNTSPFAFNWRDDKAAPNDGAEHSLRQSAFVGEVQTSGCKNPNSSGTSGNDGCLLTRHATTGADQRDNSSGFYGKQRSLILPDGVTGTWAIGRASDAPTAQSFGYRYTNVGSPGAPFSLGATTAEAVPHAESGPAMVLSGSLVVGSAAPVGAGASLCKKFNASGVLTDSLATSALPSSVSGAFAASIVEGGAYSLLIAGGTRLWLLGTALTVSSNTSHDLGRIFSQVFGWRVSGHWLYNSCTPNGNYVFLQAQCQRLGNFSSTIVSKLYRIAVSGMSLLTITQFGTQRDGGHLVVACDNTRVYVRTSNGGNSIAALRAYNVSTGVEEWSRTDGVHTRDRGRVLPAGLALFGSGGSGVLLLNPATGATIATIDNNSIYDVAEFSSQIFCVGQRRQSHE